MADPVLSDLLPAITRDEVEAMLLAVLSVPKNPITDWYSGGVMRTILELETEVIADLAGSSIPEMLANGYHDTASDDSLTVVARGWFGLDRAPSTVAIQTITLACDASHGPYTIGVGRYLAQTSDGQLYAGSSGGTLSTSGTLSVDMTAQSPGAARGLISDPVTKLAGVTIQSVGFKVISSVPQVGADGDTDVELATKCAGRFPDLDADPDTTDRLIAWAKEASTDPTRFRIDPNSSVGYYGSVYFYLANAAGGSSSGVVATVQAYVDERAPITDLVVVLNASNRNVTAGGTVRVKAGAAAAVKAAANTAWETYLGGAPIGSKTFLLELEKIVMDAGALDFTDATLNGVASDLILSAGEVPVNAVDLATALSWIEEG